MQEPRPMIELLEEYIVDKKLLAEDLEESVNPGLEAIKNLKNFNYKRTININISIILIPILSKNC